MPEHTATECARQNCHEHADPIPRDPADVPNPEVRCELR